MSRFHLHGFSSWGTVLIPSWLHLKLYCMAHVCLLHGLINIVMVKDSLLHDLKRGSMARDTHGLKCYCMYRGVNYESYCNTSTWIWLACHY
ncbi:hypothetical protein HanRHA438_Chr10g0451681 [Helianthus annuus]|nr:hypothetical protein HanRHA438_Chr10g0451681 [Helianthus annuus]